MSTDPDGNGAYAGAPGDLFHGRSGGHILSTTVSAGVAGYPNDGGDLRTIMANADEAMYVSKRTGKNRLTVFSENMYEESFRKHEHIPR